MLAHIRATWCNVCMREKTNPKEYFMQPWTPPAHIFTFVRYLDKHQKLRKAIRVPISNTNKTIFFVVWMYAIKDFTEEDMMKYKYPNQLKRRLGNDSHVFYHPLRHAKSVLRRPRCRKQIQECGQHHPHCLGNDCSPRLYKHKQRRCNWDAIRRGENSIS